MFPTPLHDGFFSEHWRVPEVEVELFGWAAVALRPRLQEPLWITKIQPAFALNSVPLFQECAFDFDNESRAYQNIRVLSQLPHLPALQGLA